MTSILQPQTPEEAADYIASAATQASPLELLGRGSKRGFGRPLQCAATLDLSAMAGISLYEPDELVLSAGAGTALAEIEATVAAEGQMLAFEPPDLGPLLGGAADAGSLGGAIACNLAGPRRLKAGAARDHVLGFTAVNGRGEVFKSGGRVMKNVTGYDMMKLLAGSHGTLAAMTAITLKILPRPEKTYTVLLLGLDGGAAGQAMRRALTSAHEVSSAAHLPAELAAASGVSYVAGAGRAITALRVEGPGPSVLYRTAALRRELADLGETEELHSMNSGAFWAEIRDVRPFVADQGQAIWRISVPPASGPACAASLSERISGSRSFMDWGGGLIWLAAPPAEDAGAVAVRTAVSASGGHATLLRASAALRAALPVFQPQADGLQALTRRIKASFDPKGIFNPGRMYEGV